MSQSTTPTPAPPDRVQAARERIGDSVRKKFEDAKVAYPARRLFFRAFKEEGELEVWASDSKRKPYVHVATYPILKGSGLPGPKRREGDMQVPEGFYLVDRFNPQSLFHLSLGLNYPNSSDMILSDKVKPGYDIFIHGSDLTVGCMPMGDDNVEEIYLLAADAGKLGTEIPVHIYPCRFTEDQWQFFLEPFAAETENFQLITFWLTLEKELRYFEKEKKLAQYRVADDGSYEVLIPKSR